MMHFIFVLFFVIMTATTCQSKTLMELNRHRRKVQAMGKETPEPTRAPTRPPTRAPTRPPTRPPTLFPTAFPTEKRGGMNNDPVAVRTNAPVSNPPVAFTNAPISPTTVTWTFAPTTLPPVTVTVAPTTQAPITAAPSTKAPTLAPTAGPTTTSPSSLPSQLPTAAPVVATGSPVAPVSPTQIPTSSMQLQEFSLLLKSSDPVLNVKQLDLTMESYLTLTMMIENLESVALTPISASSAAGANFTSTSIRFAGTATFSVELPTSSVLFASQEGVLQSTSGIQSLISGNPNLAGVEVVQVSFDPLDPTSLVEGEEQDQNSSNEDGSSSNAAVVVPIVLILSLIIIAGGVVVIRRRRRSNAQPVEQSLDRQPAKSYNFSTSQYPDIELHEEPTHRESVNTPLDDEESDGDADLSSYIMTATPTSHVVDVVEQSPPTEVQQSERPEEINVSHIEDASEDGYSFTDDESARFGATDMSECTFKG